MKRLAAATLAYVSISNAYLLILLAAANTRLHPPASSAGELQLLMLVPAHNEAQGMAPTLRSLQAQVYPRSQRELVVVADNCSDGTAEVARSLGASVLERSDSVRVGKGHALAWAIGEVLRERPHVDAVIIVDADCVASPNLLSSLGSRLAGGAQAVQSNYVVANPEQSAASALRYAAFAMIATVRPMGKARLGLSCGLFGSGMAISRHVLKAQPWTQASLVEDFEYHLRLVDGGVRVHFAPEGRVASAMPTSLASSESQQMRWEKGKWQVIKHWTPRLVLSGLLKADPVRVHAGLEQAVLPQSLSALASFVTVVTMTACGNRRLAALGVANGVAQVAFVAGGLRLVRAPWAVYRALTAAPALVAQKAVIYSKLVLGRGPRGWVRTARGAEGV